MTERFVIWSPRAAACMTCTTRHKAERLVAFWRDTRLLGCVDWVVSRVTDQPGSTEFQTLDDAPPTAARLQAANDLSAGSLHAELLADKDAVITQLRHKLNDHVLSSVREAALQNRRIAELEAQLASCRARDARRKVI